MKWRELRLHTSVEHMMPGVADKKLCEECVLPNGTLRRPHLSLEEFARLSPIPVIAPVAEASEWSGWCCSL